MTDRTQDCPPQDCPSCGQSWGGQSWGYSFEPKLILLICGILMLCYLHQDGILCSLHLSKYTKRFDLPACRSRDGRTRGRQMWKGGGQVQGCPARSEGWRCAPSQMLWKHNNMEVWKYNSMEVWEYNNMKLCAIWKLWEYNSSLNSGFRVRFWMSSILRNSL